jgi:hypothetical protein
MAIADARVVAVRPDPSGENKQGLGYFVGISARPPARRPFARTSLAFRPAVGPRPTSTKRTPRSCTFSKTRS